MWRKEAPWCLLQKTLATKKKPRSQVLLHFLHLHSLLKAKLLKLIEFHRPLGVLQWKKYYFLGLQCIYCCWIKHINTERLESNQTILVFELAINCLRDLYTDVTTIQSLELSHPRNIREDFFLKIGILRAKVYTKNTPNIEECNFIPAPLRTMTIKQVIEVLY